MLGYKKAKTENGDYCIVTLELLDDSITNINRKYIENINFASHRCNKAKVVKIEKLEFTTLLDTIVFDTAISCFYEKKQLTYNLGKIIQTLFDYNIENVNSDGIHFYSNKNLAILYNIDSIENGTLINYWENGGIYSSFTYENNKKNGEYFYNWENGNKKEQGIMHNDKKLEKIIAYDKKWEYKEIYTYNELNTEFYYEKYITLFTNKTQ